MSPNGEEPTNRKEMTAVSTNIRKAASIAIKQAAASGNTKWPITFKVNDPECPAYPCQCGPSPTYCCVCQSDECVSLCQAGCEQWETMPCNDVYDQPCTCATDSDCPGACADSLNCPCSKYTPP